MACVGMAINTLQQYVLCYIKIQIISTINQICLSTGITGQNPCNVSAAVPAATGEVSVTYLCLCLMPCPSQMPLMVQLHEALWQIIHFLFFVELLFLRSRIFFLHLTKQFCFRSCQKTGIVYSLYEFVFCFAYCK